MNKRRVSNIERKVLRIISNETLRLINVLKIGDNEKSYWEYSENGKTILPNSEYGPRMMAKLLVRESERKGLSYKIRIL